MNDESGEPPRAQHGCTTMVSTVHNVTRDVHRQCIKTGKLVQDVVFMSQIVQPLTTPLTFVSVKIDGAKGPRRRRLRGGGARPSTSRVQQEYCTTSGSKCGASSRNLSKFRAHFAPMANEASAIGRASLPSGTVTDTCNPVLTHLMSKACRDALACSFMTPIKIACALFHGLFIGSSSRVARMFTPLNESGLLVRPCWISFNTFLRTTHGSDPSLNHRNTIIFVSIKYSLVTIGEFPVEQV